MDERGEISGLASKLALAVEITMNPLATQNDRMEAYMVCKRFKDLSPFCVQVGFLLVKGQFPLSVRHFGLQLLEHTVKFQWNTLSPSEKLFLKENAMELLARGFGAAEDPSLTPLKDALSRVIVEIIKWEWPRQWMTLLTELWDICSKGEAQAELVLLVFLRLVEDVALLQTESSQRRKVICSTLMEEMTEIFDFFMRLILLHVENFRSTQRKGNPQALSHARVLQVMLTTITSFVEWVSIEHILADEGRLLQILCFLLNDTAFQERSSECLFQILSRREKIPLQLLFHPDLITYIYQSVAAAEASVLPEAYAFLKKVVSVLAGLASHVTQDESISCRSPSFLKFLETVIMLTRHPSLTVAHGGALIWITLLRCKHIAKNPALVDALPKIISIAGSKIIRVTYPAKRPVEIPMDPRVFASLDYDSEEEFMLFFHRCRIDFIDIFRHAMMTAPLVTFGFCGQWMSLRLQKALAGEVTSISVHDPAYMEWEALSFVLDAVVGQILLIPERSFVQSGIKLLEDCLKVDSTNPLVLSVILSCISALFMFLNMSSSADVSLLFRVLQKIFACVVYTDSSPEPSITCMKAVKNLRLQSSALMVRLSIKYPLLLLPAFDDINSTVQGLIATPNQLSRIEKTNLQEALLQISNHLCDYERQTAFVGEVLAEGRQLWAAMMPAFKSPRDFIHFVGLDFVPRPGEVSYTVVNRKQLTYAINIVAGVIRRCSWPNDHDRAFSGGFVVGLTESGNPVYRNPASPHVIPLLPQILSLVRVMNELFSSIHFMVESFRGVLAILQTEKRALIGMPVVTGNPMDPEEKEVQLTEMDRMQQFLNFTYETSIKLIGMTAWYLGQDLYQTPGIADAVIGNVFANVENVPDYGLRIINKFFMRSFVIFCPPAFYDAVLLPVFAYWTPFMLNRLTARCQYISSLYESSELGGDAIDTQEEIEDVMYRVMTSEYLELLKMALVGNRLVKDHSNAMSDETMNQDDLAAKSDTIGNLGGRLLHHPAICNSIVRTMLNILKWNDSNSSFKATLLTEPIIRYLARVDLITDALASCTMISVLQSLHVHGKDETNQHSFITLGVQIYEILRPKFPIVIEVMKKIPNVTVADVQKLDEKIAKGSMAGNKIKKGLRELFQKITSQVIGKNSGQLFNEIKIVGLPPLQNQNSQRRND